MGLQDLLKERLSVVHLKHSNIWPSADVKPMSNDPLGICDIDLFNFHHCQVQNFKIF